MFRTKFREILRLVSAYVKRADIDIAIFAGRIFPPAATAARARELLNVPDGSRTRLSAKKGTKKRLALAKVKVLSRCPDFSFGRPVRRPRVIRSISLALDRCRARRYHMDYRPSHVTAFCGEPNYRSDKATRSKHAPRYFAVQFIPIYYIILCYSMFSILSLNIFQLRSRSSYLRMTLLFRLILSYLANYHPEFYRVRSFASTFA